MENNQFQDLVLSHFKELSGHLGKITQKLEQHDQQFDQLQKDVTELKGYIKELNRKVISIEELTANSSEFRNDTRNTLDEVRHDINYLIRKTSMHSDEIILLKKAK